MPKTNDRLSEVMDQILRLRRRERSVDPDLRLELAAARRFIETTIGPTIKPAAAARLLGVSQTALTRWLGRGEIASVRTPEGRREIPRDEVIDILEHAQRLGASQSGRPLAVVLRDRRRAAEDAIDLDRLLPRRQRRGHRAAELHSLAYHRLVAERLSDQLAEHARARLNEWIESGRIHPRWADEWQRVLSLPLPKIGRAISADTPHARELRQTSPFAGVLNEHERRQLVEAVERRVSA